MATPTATTIRPTAVHAATWGGRPAVIVISPNDARVEALTDEGAWVHQAFIAINDLHLWMAIIDDPTGGTRDAILIQDDTALWTTIDGAYNLARLGVRLFQAGTQLHPAA